MARTKHWDRVQEQEGKNVKGFWKNRKTGEKIFVEKDEPTAYDSAYTVIYEDKHGQPEFKTTKESPEEAIQWANKWKEKHLLGMQRAKKLEGSVKVT